MLAEILFDVEKCCWGQYWWWKWMNLALPLGQQQLKSLLPRLLWFLKITSKYSQLIELTYYLTDLHVDYLLQLQYHSKFIVFFCLSGCLLQPCSASSRLSRNFWRVKFSFDAIKFWINIYGQLSPSPSSRKSLKCCSYYIHLFCWQKNPGLAVYATIWNFNVCRLQGIAIGLVPPSNWNSHNALYAHIPLPQ